MSLAQECTNWIRDLFHAYNGRMSVVEWKRYHKDFTSVWGKDLIAKQMQTLIKDRYIVHDHITDEYVWGPVGGPIK